MFRRKNWERHWKPHIWGQNPRFDTTGQIISKVPQRR